MNISNLRTDATKESEGVWVPLDPETSIKVRYTDTLSFGRAVKKKYKPFRNGFRVNKDVDQVIPEAEQEAISIGLILDEVLVDWKGVKDGDVEIPFSKDKAREFLKIKAFRDLVEAAAADISNFRAEEKAGDAKNSEPVSDGQ